jgi:hypothetical protein
MAYTNATYFVSQDTGSDTARTALTTCVVSNPASTTTNVNKTAHGLVTGAVVALTLFDAWLNANWMITVVDADNFTLDTAVWVATVGTSGTVTPFGGSSKADAWKTSKLGAIAARVKAGDTVRFMASPDPTSTGQNATWTGASYNGATPSGNIASSTNATPIAITCSVAHGRTTGDYVCIAGHTTNTKANGTIWKITVTSSTAFTLDTSVGNGVGGATGTWFLRNWSPVILTTAVTQNVALTALGQGLKTNWTSAANVACTMPTTEFRCGGDSLLVTPNATFTTGLMAYYPLSALDLSAYQQLSFWFKITGSASVTTDSQFALKLCSDSLGVTPVANGTFNIRAPGAASAWVPTAVEAAGAIGSGINSIAIYALVDPGAGATISLDNIIACKASSAADSLTHQSLISKNTGNEPWHALLTIDGTMLVLGTYPVACGASLTVSNCRGYSGTTATQTLYKRETTKPSPLTANSTTFVVELMSFSTTGTPVTYSGGWDRTDMTTQPAGAVTYLDALGNNGSGLGSVGTGFGVSVSGFSFTRCYNALWCYGSNSTFSGIDSNNNNATAVQSGSYKGSRWSFRNTCNNGAGFAASSGYAKVTVTGNVSGNVGVGFSSSQQGATMNITGATVTNNGTGIAAIAGGDNTTVIGGTVVNNKLNVTTATFGAINLVNTTCNVLDASNLATSTAAAGFGTIRCHNYDGAGSHIIIGTQVQYYSSTSVRHTASGMSWAISLLNTTSFVTADTAAIYSLAKVAVSANTLVTMKAWLYRTDATLTARIAVLGGQIAGVATDVTTAMTAAINTWEEITLTFTPTEDGVVELIGQVYGATPAIAYFDDLTISQA